MCLYIDTNVLLHILKRERYLGLGWEIVKNRMKRCSERLVTSSFLLQEIRRKYPSLMNEVYDLLEELGVEIFPATKAILQDARSLRVNLPDSIHAATAVRAGCRYLVTKDLKDFLTEPLHGYLSSHGVTVIDLVSFLAIC